MKEGLIIFAKNAVAGKVKTRLAKTMGNETALAVYRSLLRHTREVTSTLLMDKWVFYADEVQADDLWNEAGYYKQLQQGRDLGERMNQAFRHLFDQGYEKAVIIGTDCPQINADIIRDAFVRLDEVDVVIGPAHDGGYYLLGLRRVYENLFEKMNWSVADVFCETIKRCRETELQVDLLETLHDIDEEEDLMRTGYAFREEPDTEKEVP